MTGLWRAVLPGPWPGMIHGRSLDGAGTVSSVSHAEALRWIERDRGATRPFWIVP